MFQILVADPDSKTRKALTALLQHKLKSDNIAEAEDIGSLIRFLVNAPPDLLVLDWRLPGAPMPETYQLFQKAYPDLKVILLSLDSKDAVVAKQTDIFFVHKGASTEEFISLLNSMIAEKFSDASKENRR
jgi:DNA-binding NarL/FixJ family response regulator